MRCNKKFALITVDNPKFERSNEDHKLVAGLSLAPAKLSGKNLCGHNSPGCTNICIFNEGFGKFQNVKDARLRRSHLFINNFPLFRSHLLKDLESLERWSRKYESEVYFRLNVYSDLDYMKLIPEAFDIPLNYYDYTKNSSRFGVYLAKKAPKNYDLIFSRSENNESDCRKFLKMGGNIACVWRDYNKVPTSFMGYPVIDGVSSDLWWLGQHSKVGSLKALGQKALADATGFVLD